MPQDIRVVLGCKELAGLDFLWMDRIGQHWSTCVLWHP